MSLNGTPSEPAPPQSRSKIASDWRIRPGLLFSVLLCLCWAGRERLLQIVPAILITSTPSMVLDVVVIVDGEHSYQAAARTLQSNSAAELWIFERRPNRLERRGILPSTLECTLASCEAAQIPSARVRIFPTPITSRRKLLDEIQVQIIERPESNVGLLTDEWNSRRLSGQVSHRIKQGASQVHVVPISSADVASAQWWQTNSSRRRAAEAAVRLVADWLIPDQDLPPDEVSDNALRQAATTQ